jgi:hypothetical protein
MWQPCEARGSYSFNYLKKLGFYRADRGFYNSVILTGARNRAGRGFSGFSRYQAQDLLDFWVCARKRAEICCAGRGFRWLLLK